MSTLNVLYIVSAELLLALVLLFLDGPGAAAWFPIGGAFALVLMLTYDERQRSRRTSAVPPLGRVEWPAERG
jgi:hypothetical protein